jgi:hypothetical protein
MARMRRLVIAFAVLATGCASHTRISAGEGGAAGVRVGVDVRSGSAVGAVIAIGALAAIYGSGSERSSPPALLEGRTVREQDCTKPLEDPSANLRCR